MNGMVYLVGAGPGDYRLITLKGKECLEKADVVICDYLADKRLMAFAKDDIEYIYVGKKAGNHAMRQEDISQLIADKAKEGKCVVRLKGGDPFVFGRGGEEAEVLKKNNVAFEIVPGISSAIAAPAYAGIPVTNRKVAVSFAVITGHEDPTKGKSDINWEKLATAVDTLVFLMGVGNLPHITSQLIKYGRSADTPAALVRWGTKAEQEVLVTTVGNAVEDVKKHNLKPPAVFVVGNVVNLRQTIQWFDNKPLFGKNILVTRAREQASKLTTALEDLGANCIEAPAIKITTPDDDFASLDKAIAKIGDFVLEEIGKDEEHNAVIKERRNGQGAEVAGVTVEGKVAYLSLVQLQAGVTWQKSHYTRPEKWSKDSSVPAEKRIFRTPDWYGYFTATYSPVKPLNIALSGTYTGSMIVQHMKGYIPKDIAVTTPDFFDMNLKISYDFSLYKFITLQLNAGIQNIFNAYQRDFDQGKERDSGYIYGPSMPRSYFAGAKLMF